MLRRRLGEQVYGAGVWASLALMCASALCGSITDLAFDLEGYLWQLVNCLFTASYSLYLRGVMDKVVALTVNKTRLDEFSMVCSPPILCASASRLESFLMIAAAMMGGTPPGNSSPLLCIPRWDGTSVASLQCAPRTRLANSAEGPVCASNVRCSASGCLDSARQVVREHCAGHAAAARCCCCSCKLF